MTSMVRSSLCSVSPTKSWTAWVIQSIKAFGKIAWLQTFTTCHPVGDDGVRAIDHDAQVGKQILLIVAFRVVVTDFQYC